MDLQEMELGIHLEREGKNNAKVCITTFEVQANKPNIM